MEPCSNDLETKSGTLYCNLYLNNKLLNTSGSIVCSNFGDFTGAKTTIGSQTSGQYPVNGLIENFVYSPKVLSFRYQQTIFLAEELQKYCL